MQLNNGLRPLVTQLRRLIDRLSIRISTTISASVPPSEVFSFASQTVRMTWVWALKKYVKFKSPRINVRWVGKVGDPFSSVDYTSHSWLLLETLSPGFWLISAKQAPLRAGHAERVAWPSSAPFKKGYGGQLACWYFLPKLASQHHKVLGPVAVFERIPMFCVNVTLEQKLSITASVFTKRLNDHTYVLKAFSKDLYTDNIFH